MQLSVSRVPLNKGAINRFRKRSPNGEKNKKKLARTCVLATRISGLECPLGQAALTSGQLQMCDSPNNFLFDT